MRFLATVSVSSPDHEYLQKSVHETLNNDSPWQRHLAGDYLILRNLVVVLARCDEDLTFARQHGQELEFLQNIRQTPHEILDVDL